MRIDDLNRNAGTQTTEQAGPAGQSRSIEKESSDKNIPDSTSAVGADQAEVSHVAQSLAAPGSGRLEQLRLSVQAGTYDVPAQAVASALIDAHLAD